MKIKAALLILFQFFFISLLYAHSSTKGLLKFIENKNQLPEQVLYHSKLNFGELFIEKNSNTFVFYDTKIGNGIHHNENYAPLQNQNIKFHSVKMEFVNANISSVYSSENKQSAYFNYFIGSDYSKWASNVFSYSDVISKNIYAGIDLHYYSVDKIIKYDYVVNPFADANLIKIKYSGADKIEIENNELLLHTSVGVIKEILPEVYQIIKGKKTKVKCNYLLNNNVVSFQFPFGYNKNNTLIIDPSIIFSSFTGSTADNWGFTATYDNLGNAYAGGIAFSAGYPVTVGAYQVTFNGGIVIPGVSGGFDMAISKFSSSGNTLLYSTYLGGHGNEQPHSLVVNSKNELYIFGRTNSNDYPVTASAYDISYNDSSDIVVSRLNPLGNILQASTYIGGSGDDGVNFSSIEYIKGELKYNYSDDARGEIILDDNSNVYVAACTNSPNFPTTAGCFQPNKASMQDACVFKLDSNLSNLIFSSYLGGSNRDAAYALSLSKNNEVIVVGGTQSTDLITTPGVLHTTYQGGKADGFIYKLNTNASNIVAASYIGTNQYDQIYFVQVDKDDDVYVYGQTEGVYPVTAGKYNNPNSGQFIHKMNIDLNTTIYSTVFGTGQLKPDISPTAFLVDRCENVYCAGWGGSLYGYNNAWSTTIGLPVTPDAFQTTTNSDDIYFFILKKNADSLAYATYFGGVNSKEHVDGGTCRFDKNGIIYQAVCAGCGSFDDMPTTPGVVSNTNNSLNCNYGMIKYKIDLTETTANFNFSVDTLGCAPFDVKFANNSLGFISLLWDFDDGTTSQDTSPRHTFYSPGIYNVKLITYNPKTCNEKDTAIKKIYVQAPFLINPIGNIGICKGDSIELDATYSAAISYTWTPSYLVSPSANSNKVKVSPTTTSTFSVMVDDGPCTVTDVATVTVNQNNTKIIPQGTIIICTDSIVELSCNEDKIIYKWYPTGKTKSITVSNPGMYKLNTIDAFGCKAKDSVMVEVQNKVIVKAFLDTTVCQNQNVILKVQGASSYTWSPSIYLNDSTKNEVVCKPLQTVEYIVIGKEKRCVGFDTVKITVIPNPKIDLGEDFYVRAGEQIKLIAKTDSLLEWFPSDKLSCNKCISPLFIADTSIFFYATAANKLGCILKDSVAVYVDYDSSIYLPNCFTPNNDFTNDVYNVVTYGVVSYSMQIYNRWGELVYQWTEKETGWDGTYKGVLAKQDVYAFIFKGVDVKNKNISIDGNITLIR